MLFDPLKEELDLPTILVDPSNSASGEFCVVGDELVLFLLLFIEEGNNPQIMPELLHKRIITESNHFISEYSWLIAERKNFCYKNVCISLRSRYKEYALLIQGAVPVIIDVSAVKCKDASSCQSEASFFLCFCYFMYPSFCHSDYLRNITAIIEENMNLEGSFARPVFRPREDGETEIYDRSIKRIEWIFEGELLVRIGSE